MKINLPNYYQAGGPNDRGVSTSTLEVYDDEGRIAITAPGVQDIQITWTQSCFMPLAGTPHRLWNVEMAMSTQVSDPILPWTITFEMPYALPLFPATPLIGYFTTSLKTTSLNATPYWTATNDPRGNVVLTFQPSRNILSEGLELIYLNLTLATLISS